MKETLGSVIEILLLLIFVSKISFSYLPFFPKQASWIVFQYGMHPYVNMFFTFIIGSILLLKWLFTSDISYRQSRFYRFYIFISCMYLVFITFMQSYFVNTDESFFMQMGSAFMAIFTVYLFGRTVPMTLSSQKFVEIVKKICIALCWLSFFLLFVFPGNCFKGGRFVGIFKHIPHMVSCATLACFGIYHSLFSQNLNRIKKIFFFTSLIITFYVLILTGTRSALAAVLVGLFLCLIFFKSSSASLRLLKFSLAISGALILLFFGDDIGDYTIGVVRGSQSIGDRAAQDGVKTRWEEVQRGLETFQKNEWLGQGLLSKFSNGSDAEVTGYNANKDPHNLIVSAGVIGGWGFILLSCFGFAALTVSTIRSLKSKSDSMKILAIYMLTQLPILFIYHVHLSIGGIADRIYWIVFGYLAIKEIDLLNDKKT